MNINQAILHEMIPGHSPLSTAGRRISGWILTLLVVMLMAACAPMKPRTTAAPAPEESIGRVEAVSGAPQEALSLENGTTAETGEEMQTLPVRFQQPAYYVNQLAQQGMEKDTVEPVGADITTTSGPVPLLDIIKRLAALKNMNVSWASDVDKNVMTDVDIRADEDFFQAVDNLLRQVDYFHEVHDNTLVIRYKETRKFHLAMPPRLTTIASSSNTGNAAVTSLSADTSKNRWDDVRRNLDQILDIWETAPPAAAPAPTGGTTAAGPPQATTVATAGSSAGHRSGKGYYSINELIGLITVTAPRPLLAKIAEYIDDIKEELYRQVSIEAKIIEVNLLDHSTTGLDWSKLLNEVNIDFELFGGTGQIHPRASELAISKITIPSSINAVLDAIAEQGDIKVLSNPKVSVMNGQPAIIYVGDNLTYIDTVTTTVDEGVATTSVTTAQVTSGVRLEVYPTIISDDEIILSLTPMISGLTGDIRYEEFGAAGQQNKVGVPEVSEKTMNSIVRIKDGQMLVIGGMIKRTDSVSENKVRLLGDLPVLNNLFKSKIQNLDTTEIVILLQPRII
jgi:MSHA type pilus biogenesis protein MshL